MKTAAIIGWSGYGQFGDLTRTVSSKLGVSERRVAEGARSLTVRMPTPSRSRGGSPTSRG